MSTTENRIEPVRSEVEVDLPPSQAFELFTAHISLWWPLHTHSVHEDKTETVVFELAEGGEIFELAENSVKVVWGTVRTFEPPRRVIFSWHPGRDSSTAQEVEVTFHPTDAGTRIELEHRGWEALGEDARATRDDYQGGWAHVLGECFVKAASD